MSTPSAIAPARTITADAIATNPRYRSARALQSLVNGHLARWSELSIPEREELASLWTLPDRLVTVEQFARAEHFFRVVQRATAIRSQWQVRIDRCRKLWLDAAGQPARRDQLTQALRVLQIMRDHAAHRERHLRAQFETFERRYLFGA